jgi:2-polyprenyl-3-methyl-5-hydroxy-6-metoxy-1,4-benzoquinol methylase
MRDAIDHGMILKDATPYNIQFRFAQPVLIDTLSFEKYDETKPWIAYRQFCETFLYPLVISKYTSCEVHRLFAAYPEGVPAKETVQLLPAKARFNVGNWLHIFLPASLKPGNNTRETVFSKAKLLRIVEHLHQIIDNVKIAPGKNSSWKNYYDRDILSEEYLSSKQVIVNKLIKAEAQRVLDLGCNQGVFSRLFAAKNNYVIAADSDAISISIFYQKCRQEKLNILPLCIDIVNPPGNAGFMNQERKAFVDRSEFDVCIALALVHHLSIGKNIPFQKLAEFSSTLCSELIIEFVPKDDEKVLQLLSTREDIFDWYNQSNFENSFGASFTIEEVHTVKGSNRIIYRMKNKKLVDLK